ncbi:MAG: Electron transport complex protein RnfE [uncultured Thiotrichaceae bacterium]|uniref:Ion-translocating oxidoreductase complex subunit E n=1 Tax=uncultured Thiotrichaceae bacterium TaxID=298394 RepID=A0A6S6TRH9_9GAMM|nr:MAG: Electron transport complex protein RnfE [uncultured Thiotrichaceae bacterium]
MADVDYRKITSNGLWTNNPGLVQLLGLCPLMAVTNNTINGLGLGIATILTLVFSSTGISIFRKMISDEIRLPVFVLIIAATVTAIELIMHAYFFELYHILGIFIPLIVTNCIIIGRAEAFAVKNSPPAAFWDALMMGIGFALVLIALGAMRELFAQGTLLDQAHLMFGESASGLTIHLIDDYKGFLLAALPPGAFIGLGLLLAIKNWIDLRYAEKAKQKKIQSNLSPQNA